MSQHRPWPDLAKGEVTNSLADEELAGTYAGNVLDALRQIEPTERQNYLAEVHRRSTRTTYRRTRSGMSEAVEERIRPHAEVLAEVLAEYKAWTR